MREKEYLRKRYGAVVSSIGFIFLISGALMLTPLLILFSHPEESPDALAFLSPSACLLLMGTGLWHFFRSTSDATLSVQEGGIIVVISWIGVILFSAWPFASISEFSFSRAVFESMSGWTTTGLSVMNVKSAGPMILIWRSIIQLAGGAGLAIIMMSAITGPTGVSISSAEGRGDQLAPNVKQSARLVLIIYLSYAVLGTLAYRVAGLSFFDAVNHAFAAVSTGGFSTRAESIGYWNSIPVEAVTLTLMILGNLSFVTAWLLWQGKFRSVIRNGEVRLITALIPFFSFFIFLLTCRTLYPQLEKSLRVAVFETVSAITTTGFSTVSYTSWNAFGIFSLVVLMLIGGGTCSTAGGMKQFRIYLLWRVLVWEIQRCLKPGGAILQRPLWEGGRKVFVDDASVRQVTVFVFLYLTTYVFGVLILCACGFNLEDSLFEFASALGTVGLSAGLTSYTMPEMALWAEILAMFLGRLEFLVVILSLIKLGKDVRRFI